LTHCNALVTLVLGDTHRYAWKKYCEPSWRAYAAKFDYDLIALEKPLDTTERAKSRSPSWQKCLVPAQDWAQNYERLVWLDADIIINARSAPSITDAVPTDRVGAVSAYANPSVWEYVVANRRNTEYWKKRGSHIDYEDTPRSFYENWGFQVPAIEDVAHAGVLVLSPQYHREVFEHVYYSYEDVGSGGLYEMRALSYELMQAGIVHWLDPRFNALWMMDKLLHYPFLFQPTDRTLSARVKRRLTRELGVFSQDALRRACETTSFLNCYFLHFAGQFQDIGYVDVDCTGWDSVRMSTEV
jgi:hypothetical protein